MVDIKNYDLWIQVYKAYIEVKPEDKMIDFTFHRKGGVDDKTRTN